MSEREVSIRAWAVIPTEGGGISWRTYPTRAEARQRAADLKDRFGFRAARVIPVRIVPERRHGD